MQTTLERTETALPYRFDLGDYHRMAEAGILGPEHRLELFEGEIVDMAPIGSAHGGTVMALTALVARAVADGTVLASVQAPPGPAERAPAGFDAPAPAARSLPKQPPHRRRRAAPGRGRRQLARLRPRPQSRPLSPPRRARGVDRRPSRRGGRGLSRAWAGGLCRAQPGHPKGSDATASARVRDRRRYAAGVSVHHSGPEALEVLMCYGTTELHVRNCPNPVACSFRIMPQASHKQL